LLEGKSMSAKGLLIDITKCIGCGACHDACAEANGNPQTPAETWNHESWVCVRDAGGDVYVRRQCMHCDEPACASVCPVAALHKTEEGPVAYRAERCMGCRYCMVACPFGVPKYEWEKPTPLVRKCILCEPRLREGKPTACSEACPTGATRFGEREELLQEARALLLESPGTYEPHIFGEREVGGTCVLYLAPKGFDFEAIGLTVKAGQEPMPELTYRVLSKIPTFAEVTGTALLGLFWIINRRMTLAQEDVTWKRVEVHPAEGKASPDEGRGRS
jgi:formate dehydrogenase iron-sulfur subunit